MRREFELKQEHVDLLSAMRWESAEWGSGGPTCDAKRPFGNSSYHSDVCHIVGWEEPDDGWTDEQIDDAEKLFSDTTTALEVILSAKSFKPGLYKENAEGKWIRK